MYLHPRVGAGAQQLAEAEAAETADPSSCSIPSSRPGRAEQWEEL